MSEASYMASVDTYYPDKQFYESQRKFYESQRKVGRKMIYCENPCPDGKFNGCCYCCPERDKCPEPCPEDVNDCGEATFDEETGLVEFQKSQLATLESVAALVKQKKELEDQEKALKAALFSAMEKFGIKKFESDVLNLTYVAPTSATSIDGAKVKKLYPQVAAECSKTTSKAGYVKITLKDGDNNAG